MELNKITEKIIGCAMRVHTRLGPGLLESAYETCLIYELTKSGLKVENQKAMPLIYDEVKMDVGYRLDILVEGTVVVEVKAVEYINDVHLAQTITYLNLSKSKIGLIINFNVASLKDGIKRVIPKDSSYRKNELEISNKPL